MRKLEGFEICGLAALLVTMLFAGCGMGGGSHPSSTGSFKGGGGGTQMHSVDLNWGVSTSPVVGYNVYRSLESGGPYQLLNSSPTSSNCPAGTCAFTDSAAQSGHTYFYVVTGVDSGGIESAFSNEVTAVIP